MSDELQLALAVLAVFVVYVVAKVRSYMRQSKADWQQVDRTKLKKWDDEED
jgi:hypothetical protein